MRTVAANGGRGNRRARGLDARLPTRLAMAGGAGAVILTTFLYSRHVNLGVSWIPAAVAAIAGWCCLVVFLLTIAEMVQIWRGGAQISAVEQERHLWATQQWIPPAMLVTGILIGWWLFK
jgi:hypothetical protein